MQSMAVNITHKFIDVGIIGEDQKQVFEFGLSQAIFMCLNYLAVILIGIFANELYSLFVFSVSYLLLRPYAGGYHASSKMRCFVISIIMFSMVAFIPKYLYFEFYVYLLMIVVSTGLMLVLSPIEDNHKPLDEIERRVYKKKLVRRLLLQIAFSGLCLIYSHKTLKLIAISFLMNGFMVTVGAIKNKRLP